MPVHVAAYVVLVCSVGEFPMLKLFVPVGCTSVTCVVLVPTVISAVKVVTDVVVLYIPYTGQYTRVGAVLRYIALSFLNTFVDINLLEDAALLLLPSKLHWSSSLENQLLLI
jgi:hypothetical protein